MIEPAELEDQSCAGCGQVHERDGQLDLFGHLDDEDWSKDYGGEDLTEHLSDMVGDLGWFNAADVGDGMIELSPLGAFLAGAVFQRSGLSRDDDAAAVVAAVGEFPLVFCRTVAGPWLSARSATEAVDELFTFAESASGELRMTALAFIGELGSDAAQALREWSKRAGIGAYARLLLRTLGEEVPEDPADDVWLATDGLCVLLETESDAMSSDLLSAILAAQLGGDAAEAVRLIGASDHPKAELVATWIGSLTSPPTEPAAVEPAVVEPAAAAPAKAAPAAARRTKPDLVVYQLKITLRGISKPPVWRRVLVPASITLRRLHAVIQDSMGWHGGHLYMFEHGSRQYGAPVEGLGLVGDSRIQLSQLLARPGDKLRYTYDFGDDWEHDIVVEEISSGAPAETYPSCTAGKGACPPEDCGGPWGYANLKMVLADPSSDDHENTLEWLGLADGADFDPKEFSVADVNAILRASKR